MGCNTLVVSGAVYPIQYAPSSYFAACQLSNHTTVFVKAKTRTLPTSAAKNEVLRTIYKEKEDEARKARLAIGLALV
jgi:hypothetical protein